MKRYVEGETVFDGVRVSICPTLSFVQYGFVQYQRVVVHLSNTNRQKIEAMNDLVKWFDDNRKLITVKEAEQECNIPSGVLNKAIKGTRNLPKKYIEPLTILKDSLDNGTPPKENPKQISVIYSGNI